MSWINWNDVDRFMAGYGLSQQEAKRLNADSIIQEKRKEYQPFFDMYKTDLEAIVYAQTPEGVIPSLLTVPDEVLIAFFGIGGLQVVKVKHAAEEQREKTNP